MDASSSTPEGPEPNISYSKQTKTKPFMETLDWNNIRMNHSMEN
jgi:hypothetical protein